MELVEKHPEFKAGKVEDMLLLRMLVMVMIVIDFRDCFGVNFDDDLNGDIDG